MQLPFISGDLLPVLDLTDESWDESNKEASGSESGKPTRKHKDLNL